MNESIGSVLLGLLGGVAGAALVLKFLSGYLLSHWFGKEMEKFKAGLQRELQAHQGLTEIDVARGTRVDAQRAKAAEEISGLLSDLISAAAGAHHAIFPSNATPTAAVDAVKEKLDQLMYSIGGYAECVERYRFCLTETEHRELMQVGTNLITPLHKGHVGIARIGEDASRAEMETIKAESLRHFERVNYLESQRVAFALLRSLHGLEGENRSSLPTPR